jgi:hypothetical protein
MSEPQQMTYAQAANLYAELEARAASRRQRPGRRPRRRLAYVLAGGSCVVALLVVAMVLLSGGGAHHPSRVSGGGGNYGRGGLEGVQPAAIGSDPFGAYGRRVTLAKAARLLGAPVPTPNVPLANAGNLSVVWGVHGEAVLDYVGSQIRITVEPANPILRSRPKAAFKEMARGSKMAPGFLLINGDPALVVGGGVRKAGFAQVVREGLSIAVMGHRSASELIAIARSLKG